MPGRKLKVLISSKARIALKDILVYTRRTWGYEQYKKYNRTLKDAFKKIAQNPLSGKARDDLYVGCRSYRVGSHVVFYRIFENHIEISRILHKSMDFERHFPEDS